MEELEFELIDSGLQEFEIDGNTVYAYGDYSNFGSLVKKHLMKRVFLLILHNWKESLPLPLNSLKNNWLIFRNY